MQAKLQEAGIGCVIYYPVPFHKQECFAYLEHKPGDLPVANRASSQVLSLPIYPELTEREQEEVIEAIKKIVS